MKREVDLGSVVGPQGEEGKSAYEVWKEQSGNEGKTEAEYLAAMKGEKGDPGERGRVHQAEGWPCLPGAYDV